MNFRQVEMYINYQKCMEKTNDRIILAFAKKKKNIYKNIYGTVNAYSTDSMQRIKLRQANYHIYVYTHIYMCMYACLKNIYTNFEF